MPAEDKILVIGSGGMIGRGLAAHLAGGGRSVVRTTRDGRQGTLALDLSGDVSSWSVPSGVSIAYLCAAVTSLEECRKNPDATRLVNVAATLCVAEKLMRSGAFVVFLSSNLVFDGTSPRVQIDAPTDPRVEYGRQKAEVERRLLSSGKPCCIVRLTKMLGPRNGLLCGWRDALLRGTTVRPFSDMVMAPVSIEFAVEALVTIGVRREAGIVQVSAENDITYEQAARHIASRLAAPEDLVSPVRVADSGLTPEWVPMHTTLDTSRLSLEYGMNPPAAYAAVEGAIEQ